MVKALSAFEVQHDSLPMMNFNHCVGDERLLGAAMSEIYVCPTCAVVKDARGESPIAFNPALLRCSWCNNYIAKLERVGVCYGDPKHVFHLACVHRMELN